MWVDLGLSRPAHTPAIIPTLSLERGRWRWVKVLVPALTRRRRPLSCSRRRGVARSEVSQPVGYLLIAMQVGQVGSVAEIDTVESLDRLLHRSVGDVDVVSHLSSGPSVDLVTTRLAFQEAHKLRLDISAGQAVVAHGEQSASAVAEWASLIGGKAAKPSRQSSARTRSPR